VPAMKPPLVTKCATMQYWQRVEKLFAKKVYSQVEKRTRANSDPAAAPLDQKRVSCSVPAQRGN